MSGRKGKKFLGFNGVALDVPEGWDLISFKGNQRIGALSLDDGQNERLRVEWGEGRDARRDAVLEDMLKEKKRELEILDQRNINGNETFIHMKRDDVDVGFLLMMQPEWDRYLVFNLFQPESGEGGESELLALAAPNESTRPDDVQEWSFFSTHFKVDPKWSLRDGRMRGGCVDLTFEREGRLMTVWDVILLDHVVKKQPLVQMALRLIEEKYPKQLKFDKERAEELRRFDEVEDFVLAGRWRRRWLVKPTHLLFGNRLARLRCVVNKKRNRFSYVLLICQREEELDWAEPLPESLAS